VATRRDFLIASGVIAAGVGLPASGSAASRGGVVEISMRSDPTGAKVGFDPIGILLAPGQTVRWVIQAGVHTTTAYHPRNSNHSLRIPKTATPWNSGYLVNPGDHFEVVLTAEGVYDYFCIPHEMAGMVGRLIVGRATGPGSLPYDYFQGKPGTANWQSVPEAARRAFPAVEVILEKKVVRLAGFDN